MEERSHSKSSRLSKFFQMKPSSPPKDEHVESKTTSSDYRAVQVTLVFAIALCREAQQREDCSQPLVPFSDRIPINQS